MSEQPHTVQVPRDLIAAAASELRAWSGHWTSGAQTPLTRHDTRMPDGSCCTCALLAELDHYAKGEALEGVEQR